ncbi:MAG TPA: hypothetical protein VKG91_12520 [Roseiarcus sp.]|nr:hypothetical protein [Roseiarcus sp.]
MLIVAIALAAICALAGFRVAKNAFGVGGRVAFIALVAISALAGEANAQSVASGRKTLPQDARFCPSWAEAHERTLASLNNGRPPYGGRWKGCVLLKKGVQIDVVGSDDEGTEIVYEGKHWFADDPLF